MPDLWESNISCNDLWNKIHVGQTANMLSDTDYTYNTYTTDYKHNFLPQLDFFRESKLFM